MRNGMSEAMRLAGYTLDPAIVQEEDGLRVYLTLQVRESKAPSVVVQPLKRPRKRANG
jgi:hypothetical protein